MGKKVFVSFRYSDAGLRNDLLQFFQPQGGRVAATPAFVTEDVDAKGDAVVRGEIQRVMSECRGLIVVVGDDTHSSKWVQYEVDLAAGRGIPAVAMRHPAAHGGIPSLHRSVKEVRWNPAEVAAEVDTWR